MAFSRRLGIDIIVDADAATRGFQKTGSAAKNFDKDLSHATRGVVAGSAAFTGLGRSLAFASAGFLGFAGATQFIRSSIDAAQGAAKAQKSLAAQLHASGESFKQNKTLIDQAGLSIGKFGFTTDDSAKALTVLDRATGNISRSIKLQTLAVDIARAKNLDLSQAALIVGKAYDGQLTSLKRLGVEIPKGVKGMDALNIASQKFAGQARANTNEFDKFHATLHDTQIIIGNALLPTIDHLLSKLSDWLDKMNRSGKLQKDVNGIIQTGTGIVLAFKDALSPLVTAFQDLGKAVGGTRNELKLLLALFAAWKASKMLEGLAALTGGLKNARGEAILLEAVLTRLKFFGPIGIAVTIFVYRKQLDKALADLAKWSNGGTPQAGALSTSAGGFNTPFSKDPGDTRPADSSGRIPVVHFNIAGGPNGGQTAAQIAAGNARRLNLPHVSGRGTFNAPFTREQTLQDELARDPNNISLLQQQTAWDKQQLSFLQRLLSQHRITNKDFQTQYRAFWNDINSNVATITSIQQAAASKAAEAARKAAAAAKAQLRADVPNRVSGTVFGVLGSLFGKAPGIPHNVSGTGQGWLAAHFNLPIATQLKQAQLEALGNTTGLNQLLAQERQSAMNMLKSGKLSVQAQIEAWNFITGINNQLSSTLSNFGPTGKVASSQALTSGIKFANAAARREQEARIAQLISHGGKLPNATSVQGVPIIHVHVDGVEKSVTVKQQQKTRYRSVQTSGIHAGRQIP